MLRRALPLLALTLPLTAWGQDGDDPFGDDDDWELETPAPAPTPESPPPETPPPPTDTDDEDGDELEEFRDDADDEFDLFGDESPERPTVGGDSDKIYRATEERLKKLPPDEEMEAWEGYLGNYPSSAYRARIENRMRILEQQMYETGRIGVQTEVVDALTAEIPFSQALQLENLNPRSRFQVGFEWGLPDYMNLLLDYEHALVRTLSVHGGVRRRYVGWNIETGARWALVKSTRTQTIVSVIGDVHLNTNPAFLGLRPQLAAGKRFGKLDVQIQGGPDFELRSVPLTRITGGANLTYKAADTVALFAESYVNMRPSAGSGTWDGGLYVFNVATIGMKFFPGTKERADEQPHEVNLGATLPYMNNYWQYHFGSIMGQYNYYL